MAKRRMAESTSASEENGHNHKHDYSVLKTPTFESPTAQSKSLPDSPAQILPARDRVAIFIDGANLFYAAVQLQIEIDYSKLLATLVEGRRLLRPYFYTGIDRQNNKQQGFILWMRRNGYRVITKDLAHLPDGAKKANLDVEIAVDMLGLANYCDTIVLLSGAGDLAYAVNAITYKGVKVEVVSLRVMSSDSLINVADRFTDLADLKEQIWKR